MHPGRMSLKLARLRIGPPVEHYKTDPLDIRGARINCKEALADGLNHSGYHQNSRQFFKAVCVTWQSRGLNERQHNIRHCLGWYVFSPQSSPNNTPAISKRCSYRGCCFLSTEHERNGGVETQSFISKLHERLETTAELASEVFYDSSRFLALNFL